MTVLLQIPLVGWWIRVTTGKQVRLVGLKPNRDLNYLSEQFEAGALVPVIDGPWKLVDAPAAFRHFGAGNHKGKIVITID
jgi:hypothetical protein